MERPDSLELPLVASKADVLVGQVVRGFALSRTSELFVGLGAGWMRATDSSTDRLLSGAGFPDPEEITGELPPDVPPELVASFVPEVEFTANRSSIVFAGSLGVSLRAGRILLRPRLDVIIARALTTELTVGFPGLVDLDLPETEELGIPGVELHHQRDPEDLPSLGGRGSVELTGKNGSGVAKTVETSGTAGLQTGTAGLRPADDVPLSALGRQRSRKIPSAQ